MIRHLAVALVAVLLSAQAIAAPISSYPAASALSGPEKIIATQGTATVNITPAQISTYVGANIGTDGTVTGSYTGQVAQTMAQQFNARCINIFSYLTKAQQDAIQADTSTLDMVPIFNYAIAAFTAPGGSGPCIEAPWGKYRMGQEWIPLKTFMLKGHGGGGGLAGTPSATRLVWDANTSGIKFRQTYFSPAQAGSNGSVLEDLSIEDAASTWTTDPNAKPAVWLNVRAVLRNVNINWTAGTGVKIAATFGDGSDVNGGNANEYTLDTVNINASGYCVHASGGDVNGGSEINVGCQQSGLAGYADLGFLGGSKVAFHADSPGVAGKGRVAQGGHLYDCVSFSLCPTTTPGTNAAVWYDLGTGSGTAWALNGSYFPSGGINTDITNGNNRSVWTSPYIEGSFNGYSVVSSPAMVVGGNNCGYFTSTSVCIDSAFGVGSFLANKTGMGGYHFLSSGSNGTYELSYAGADGIHLENQVLGVFKWETVGQDSRIIANNLGAPILFTGSFTLTAFSRLTPVPYATNIPLLALGSSSGARIVTTGSAAPTDGVYARGEIVFNNAPSSGGAPGWMCTTGGAIATASWASSHAYTVGTIVLNDTGKTYIVTTAGTSAGSGGPTGTGTGITDGTVVWNYVAPFVFKAMANLALNDNEPEKAAA